MSATVNPVCDGGNKSGKMNEKAPTSLLNIVAQRWGSVKQGSRPLLFAGLERRFQCLAQ